MELINELIFLMQHTDQEVINDVLTFLGRIVA